MKKMLTFVVISSFVFTALSWAQSRSENGKKLYDDKCSICHGANGKGDGPATAGIEPKPTDFTNPEFWKGNVDTKIAETVKKGKGEMPAFDLPESDIKAITAYMSESFKSK